MTRPDPKARKDAATRQLVGQAPAETPPPVREQLRAADARSDYASSRSLKAHAAADRFAAHPARNLTGVVTIHTRAGNVRLASIQYAETTDGVPYVDVRVAGPTRAGDPHYRIFNPPTLVEDPRGPIELPEDGEHRGRIRVRRYREDPVAAVAEAIAAHGGGVR